ncbi:MAG: hypothetical protein ACYDAO_09705, partial [Thermoplasmataceae archaeon]
STNNSGSSQKNNSNGNSNPNVCVDLKAYQLSNGIGFNQNMFVTLMAAYAIFAISASAVSAVLVGPLAGIVIAVFLIGGVVLKWYDQMGGDNGISYCRYTVGSGWFSFQYWAFNAPFDPSGSSVWGIITIYHGNLN